MGAEPVPDAGLPATTDPAANSSGTAPVYYTDRAAILIYHNLSDSETSATISPQHFAAQIASLQQKGYNFISLDQLDGFLAGQGELPPNAVVITFDDGYESVYHYAYPLLAQNHIPASMFIIVKNVGATQNQIPKMTWAEMQEMQAQGMRFYSHTYDSHHLVRSPDGSVQPALIARQYLTAAGREESEVEYERRIKDDLSLSKNILETQLGSPVNCLALPYGSETETVKQIAQACGFQYLFTVDPGLVDQTSDPLALKRINAGQVGIDGEALHNMIISYIR
jgi:biofilm PGA synthesis lipoprotein PgaB